jgi:putative tryptophan/tyrosine transport system substrate-binding protein
MIRIISWHFLITILLVANAAPAISQTKVYHVGVLILSPLESPHLKGLRDGLREAGYIEGKNLLLEIPLKKNQEELRAVTKRFITDKKDVIVALGNIETRIAYETASQIPVVFMPASDPVRLGFVKSLAHPETNLTGITYYRELGESGKQLEVFKELVTGLQRVTLVIDDGEENSFDPARVTIVREVAAHRGIKLIEKPVKSLAETERLVSSLSKATTDGILVTCTSLFSNLTRIAAISRQKLIPLHGCSSYHVTEGSAFFSYAPDLYQIGRRGAWYVNRILKGAMPQDLPVENPRKFELAINLKTANAIGIKIPPEVLQRADKVIR